MIPRQTRRGSSFIEIAVAALILGGGFVIVQSSSLAGLGEAAWGAERLQVEGLLKETETALRRFSFCDLQGKAYLKTSESAVTAADREALEEDLRLTASLLPPQPGSAADPTSGEHDPFVLAYRDMIRGLNVSREVLLEEVPAGSGTGVLTVIIKWTPPGKRAQRLESKVLVFKGSDTNC